MGKLRYILLLIIVLAVAFFTRWLLTSVEEPSARDPGLSRHDPDYFLTNFSTIVYDAKGIPSYKIKGRHLQHFPDDDTIEITQLEFEYLTGNKEPWLAQADKAILAENKNILKLIDNVILKRKTNEPAKALQINTKTLTVDFAKKRAFTQSRVKITGKNSKINAVGMIIDLESGVLTLKSKATGRYVPE